MNPLLRKALGIVIGMLVVLATSGCGSLAKTHGQNVNAAEKRWQQARSGLLLGMAQRQFDTGDLEKADKSLREAVRMDPDNARLHLLAGRIALERGELEHSANLFKMASELNAKLAEPHYYLALVYQRWSRFDRALGEYRKAYELDDENPAYLLAVGEMLAAMDRTQEALAELEPRLAYFDQNAGLRVAIGHLYLLRHDFEKAEPLLLEASFLRPDDLQILESLAMAQIAAGKSHEAIPNLHRLLRDPEYATRRDLRMSLGHAYQREGKLADAKKLYLNLTRSDPTEVEAWVKLGETVLEMKDLSGALLAAKRIAALAPKRHEGYLLAGIVFQKRNQVERALELFARAADAAPDSTAPLILQGITLETAGRPREAAAAYAQALTRQPGDAQVQRLLANVETAH